jgi:hypothetical protein
MAKYRKITKYEDIPAIVRDASLMPRKTFLLKHGVDIWHSRSAKPGLTLGARLGLDGKTSALPAKRIDDHPTAGARVFLKPNG